MVTFRLNIRPVYFIIGDPGNEERLRQLQQERSVEREVLTLLLHPLITGGEDMTDKVLNDLTPHQPESQVPRTGQQELANAQKPVRALAEARRLLRPGGRLFILESVAHQPSGQVQEALAAWSREAGLRLAPSRFVPQKNPTWLVSVATAAEKRTEAA